MGEGSTGDGLGEGGQVIREANDPQRIDDRRRTGEIAQAHAGEGERFTHRPAHDEVRVFLEQLQRTRRTFAAEFRVRFIDDDEDRKSTRLNSSHVAISYAVFCLKKKKLSQ